MTKYALFSHHQIKWFWKVLVLFVGNHLGPHGVELMKDYSTWRANHWRGAVSFEEEIKTKLEDEKMQDWI